MGTPDVNARKHVLEHSGLLFAPGHLEEAGPAQEDTRRAAVARARHEPKGQEVIDWHSLTIKRVDVLAWPTLMLRDVEDLCQGGG